MPGERPGTLYRSLLPLYVDMSRLSVLRRGQRGVLGPTTCAKICVKPATWPHVGQNTWRWSISCIRQGQMSPRLIFGQIPAGFEA